MVLTSPILPKFAHPDRSNTAHSALPELLTILVFRIILSVKRLDKERMPKSVKRFISLQIKPLLLKFMKKVECSNLIGEEL